MQSTDLEVLEQLVAWLEKGQGCFFCTVVRTWGSSPRPPGSLLACNAIGQIAGSLSGGCVEDNLIRRLIAKELATSQSEYLEYGLGQDDAKLPGLPCGGTLGVVVEPITATSNHLDQFTRLVRGLHARQCMKRTLKVSSGEVELTSAEAALSLEYDSSQPDAPVLRQWYGPKYQLLVIGAGMTSMYLASMALQLDYAVIVCDPRPAMLADWSVEGVLTLNMYPDDAIRAYGQDATTAIVALTHDPRIDDMGMMEALLTNAFYIAAMGSERTSANRRKRLLELDVPAAQLSKLRAPAGLPIGSKTPPEIALSIMAEIIAVRNSREDQHSSAQLL